MSIVTLSEGRGRHPATLLNDGSMLMVGGMKATSTLNPGTSQMTAHPRTEVDLFFLESAPADLLPATPEVGAPG